MTAVLSVAIAAPANAARVGPGLLPGQHIGVDDELDPDPIPASPDEFVDPTAPVQAGELPAVEQVDPLEDAPAPDPAVLPEADTQDLPVDEDAPPADPPVDPPGDGKVAVEEFPLALYTPEDPPQGDIDGVPSVGASTGSVGADGGPPTPTTVTTAVLDPSVVQVLGGFGLGFTLTRADGGTEPGTVTADASYNAFRDAFGADFDTRLQLVSYPACALTTPQVAGCLFKSPIDTDNILASGVLRADLVAAPDPSGSRLSDVTPSVVYVVESGADGTAGTFSATPLTPGGAWTVGVGSGSFSWSEQLPSVPLQTGGTTSGPSLSYSSQSVDGRTSVSNNQASWVGMGWDLTSGWIDRTFHSCRDVEGAGSAHPSEMCWAQNTASITLNGHTSQLIPLSGATEWRLKDDPGWRVVQQTQTLSGVAVKYWRVLTPDGTEYLFGYDDPDTAAPGAMTPSPGSAHACTRPLQARAPGAPARICARRRGGGACPTSSTGQVTLRCTTTKRRVTGTTRRSTPRT